MVTEDSLNRITLSEQDCIELLLAGKSLNDVNVDDANIVGEYNDENDEYFGLDTILRTVDKDLTADQYHQISADTWLIPDKYKNIDIRGYVLKKTSKPEEISRVELEYTLYEERGLIDILRCMVFLIDFFKENDVVWGVGRGSSVSSYILYLIGVHKIDSLKYDLDIAEFLK